MPLVLIVLLRPPRPTLFPYTTLFRSKLRETVKAGRSCVLDLLNYRKDGSSFWCSLGISPVRDEAGQVVNFVGVRSEEHTSELQSRLHLVCRLLLEKKKT